jgi:hypothetical protein
MSSVKCYSVKCSLAATRLMHVRRCRMKRTFTPRLGTAVLKRLEVYAGRFRPHFNHSRQALQISSDHGALPGFESGRSSSRVGVGERISYMG